MPFRERIKKVFKSDSTGTTPKNSPDPNGNGDRWPSNVYAPGEAMPRPKYRAPVKKDHKDRLDAFSFGNAWRRRSHVSEYSPHGSRLPSRRPSAVSRISFGGRSRRSVGGGSITGPTGKESIEVKRQSFVGPDSREGSDAGADGRRFKEPHGAAMAPRLSVEIEQEGDDDVTNVGLSRVNSREPWPPAKPKKKPQPTNNLNAGVASDHKPFTDEDLALAMKRSHLTVPARS